MVKVKLFERMDCSVCGGGGIKNGKWCTNCSGNGEITVIFSLHK
ncbi:MAG: hypothetical protein WC788_03110 [Candidatus Paceibacterota bacterium]